MWVGQGELWCGSEGPSFHHVSVNNVGSCGLLCCRSTRVTRLGLLLFTVLGASKRWFAFSTGYAVVRVLIVKAVGRPGNCQQTGGLNLPPAIDAFAVGTVLYAVQRLPD